MEKMKTLDLEGYLGLLALLSGTWMWTATVEKNCIHLYRRGFPKIYSPTTALYFHLTCGGEIERGFWYEEFTVLTGLPWWLMLEVSYAETACECGGKRFDNRLRRRMLEALGPILAEKRP